MADKITNSGLAISTNLISGIGGTVPKYIQIGTGTTAPAAADTALQTPTNDARVSGTVTRLTTTATNDSWQTVGTITAVGAVACTEAGTFDAAGTGTPATGGNIYGRSTFSAVNLAIGDAIQVTAKTVCTST
jgi:hypothetical protein